MQNALIFSPDLDGHRQVYVFVITHILKELGFNIFIATNEQKKLSNSFYFDKAKNKQDITIIDTSTYDEGGMNITLQQLLLLQKASHADLTIFPEADEHLSVFTSQLLKKNERLRGKVVGIFLRPFYYYRNKQLLNKLRFLKHFYSRWKTDEELFYSFLLKRFSLLDISLLIDENIASHNSNFTWLPDVFQQYAEAISNENEKSEQQKWIPKLKTFKDKNQNRFLFFYFGTAQFRRGYDTLLKLASETGGCFIHCGLTNTNEKFNFNTDTLISILKNEDRYFETNEYIEDPGCIEFFFRSVTHMILPYRDFFGSSGVMLQALQYGIPILAPNKGVIGYRIEKYNLGLTYSDSNINSLRSQLNLFKKMDPKCFEYNIKSYMRLQSAKELKKVLVNSFNLSNSKVKKELLEI